MTQPDASKPKKKHRPKGDGALYQRADGKWVAAVESAVYGGKRKQLRRYSKTKSGAAAKLRELRKAKDAGQLSLSGRMTLTKWLESWLDAVELRGVRPNTLRWYRDVITTHIIPQIGRTRLDAVTAQHVQHLLTQVPTGRGRQRAHQVLGMALDMAVNRGMIPRNPVAAVDRPVYLPKGRIALDLSSARRLIEAAIDLDCKPDRPKLATRWIAALITGSRKGELLGLELDRLNLSEDPVGSLPAECMDISWQLQQFSKAHRCDPKKPCGRTRPSWCPQGAWKLPDNFEYRKCHLTLMFSRPKTDAGMRLIPLDWPLLPLLTEHVKAIAEQPNPHNLVWHHLDGRPISPREDHTYWVELLDYAGLERIPLHSLRHTAATLMQQQQTSKEVRMSIMGQSSAAAHQAYIHVDTTQERAALKMLGQSLIEENRDHDDDLV